MYPKKSLSDKQKFSEIFRKNPPVVRGCVCVGVWVCGGGCVGVGVGGALSEVAKLKNFSETISKNPPVVKKGVCVCGCVGVWGWVCPQGTQRQKCCVWCQVSFTKAIFEQD